MPHRSIAMRPKRRTRELAGELIKTTLAEVGKRFSETPRSEAEIARHADGLADMFCAYLDELARRGNHY